MSAAGPATNTCPAGSAVGSSQWEASLLSEASCSPSSATTFEFDAPFHCKCVVGHVLFWFFFQGRMASEPGSAVRVMRMKVVARG